MNISSLEDTWYQSLEAESVVTQWPLGILFCSSNSIFLFFLINLYLLVIGPKLVNVNQRGNVFLYYGRHAIIYIVMSFPALAYIIALKSLYSTSKNLRLYLKLHTWTSKVMGITWEIRRAEETKRNINQDTETGAVVVINHQTWIDFIALWSIGSPYHPLRIVMKKENIILFPYILHVLLDGGITIDRSNGPAAYKKLEYVVHDASKKKDKVAIFPEGTRNHNSVRWGMEAGRKIMNFKSGAFRAAINAGVPIVPVVISPYHFIDADRLIFGKGRVIIKVLPKMSTEGMVTGDFRDLMKCTHSVMSAAYEELKEEILRELPEGHYLKNSGMLS